MRAVTPRAAVAAATWPARLAVLRDEIALAEFIPPSMVSSDGIVVKSFLLDSGGD